MPLELEQLKKKNDVVTFGKTRLVVPGRVPFELMIEFYDLRNIDSENLKAEDMRGMTNLIKRILYLENEKEKVDKFISSLYPEQITKVISFVTNYIALEDEGKKKDSSAD